MKIVSIDVGIKNLAICILNASNSSNSNSNSNNSNNSNNSKSLISIEKWDTIDLFEETNKCCDIKDKNGINCNKPAKFFKNNCFYCKNHASKNNDYKLPTSELNTYRRKNIKELQKIVDDYEISVEKKNKSSILDSIEKYIQKEIFENVTSIKCNQINIIDIGKSINAKLNNYLDFPFTDIDLVLIENQISPIANRMNCIQGMITQYFIIKNVENIVYISPTMKLKNLGDKKTTYSERKKLSIIETKKILCELNNDNIEKDKIIEKFNNSKKKDDLADCFLQAISYIFL